MAGRVAYTGGIVRNGLVLNLDAAKVDSYPRTGTTWNDISGNGNNATLINGPIFNTNNGGGVFIDGINDYINVPNSDSINFGTGSFSIELMMYLYNTDFQFILNKGAFGSNVPGYGVAIYNNSLLLGMTEINNYAASETLINLGITANSTYHVILVADRLANFTYFYINGILKSSYNISSQAGTNTTGPFDLSVTSTYDPYSNQIRYITRVYNRALSATEVLQNYNATRRRYGLLATYPSNLLTNLISRWKLDGNSTDSVGTNNGTDTSVSYVDGRIGKAAYFEIPNTSKINVGANVDYSFVQNGGVFSISLWAKFDDFNTYGQYMCGTAGNFLQDGFYFGNQASNLLFVIFTGQYNGTYTLLSSTFPLFTDNLWNHYVFVGSGSLFSVYKNGAYVHSEAFSTYTENAPSSYPLEIGKIGGFNGTNFKGHIDDMCIWDKALSPTEVAQLYNYYTS